jgi:pimeloyl-ACP methyl ester carboxylesterase
VTPLAGPDSALSVADPTTVFNFVPATLPPTPTTDLYLKPSTFLTAFANGLSASQVRILAASQRPATIGALNEPSGVPAWRTIPSWYLIGTQDQIIPPTAERAMAEHAGATTSYFNARPPRADLRPEVGDARHRAGSECDRVAATHQTP